MRIRTAKTIRMWVRAMLRVRTKRRAGVNIKKMTTTRTVIGKMRRVATRPRDRVRDSDNSRDNDIPTINNNDNNTTPSTTAITTTTTTTTPHHQQQQR